MQPFVTIKASGKDITAALGDRLLSIECHDEAEDKSDRVKIEIDDRVRFGDSGVVDLPVIGVTVEITMGYRDGKSAKIGTYLIDEISVSSPPRKLEVTGKSAAMGKAFRTPRTQSYHQKTLGEIGKEIAGRNDYEFISDPELDEIVVRHIDQHNESDMAFATRVAEEHDAVAKPVDGKLVFSKRGTGKTVSGKTLPTVTLTEADCEEWNFKYSAREESGKAAGLGKSGSGKSSGTGAGQATTGTDTANSDDNIIEAPDDDEGGVSATWTDTRTGDKKVVTVGKEPFEHLRYTYHNEAEAVAAVAKAKNKASRQKATFSCTIGGRPDMQAETRLILKEFRPYIPTEWRVKTCTHTFDGTGYVTKLDAELFNEKQDNVAGKVKKSKPGKDDKVDKNAPADATKPAAGGTGASTDDFIIEVPED